MLAEILKNLRNQIKDLKEELNDKNDQINDLTEQLIELKYKHNENEQEANFRAGSN